MNKQILHWLTLAYFMLISPFISLGISLKSKQLTLNGKKWLLIIFITIFGSVLNTKTKGGDGVDMQELVKNHYTEKSITQFSSELYQLIRLKPVENTQNDVFLHVLGYFVGSVLSMPEALFLFVGFIYAFFYVGTIFYAIRLMGERPWAWIVIALFSAFIAWKTIHDLQYIRTWTGLYVLTFASLGYFHKKQHRFLLLLLLSPCFHFGYTVMVLPVWAVIIFGNRKILYAVLFTLSFSTQLIPEAFIVNQLNKVPLGAGNVKTYYTDPSEVDKSKVNIDSNTGKNNVRFYMAYVNTNLHYLGFTIIAFSIIASGIYFNKMNFIEASIFSTGLLGEFLSNTTFFISALHNRMGVVAASFILLSATLVMSRNFKDFKFNYLIKSYTYLGMWGGFALFFPVFIWKLAGFIGWASFFLLFFPFIPWLSDINFSIRIAILHLFG